MNRTTFTALAALTLASLATVSRAVSFVDDFVDGDGLTYANGLESWYNEAAASVIGGTRVTGVRNNSAPFGGAATETVGGGAFNAGSSQGVQSSFFAIYTGLGVTADHQAFYVTDANDWDFSDVKGFKFDFISNEQDLVVNVNLFSVVYDGSWHYYRQRYATTVGANAGPFSVTLDSSNINLQDAQFDATKVDYMYLAFGNKPNGDFALDKVSSVPEPFSSIALGLGVVALVKRRRRA